MSGYQVVIQATALVGFWAAYASNAAISDSLDLQWQIPVAIQLIPGAVLLLGTFFIPESPRYIAGKETVFAVEQSLAWFRGRPYNDPVVSREARDIYDASVAVKRRQALQPTTFTRAALTNPVRKRLLVGIGLFITQNATGMNALNYFAPVVFLSIAKSVSGALFLTGIFGAVKLLSAFSYMFYCVRVLSNRFWLLSGTAICAICMFVLGYCARPEPESTDPDHTSDLTVKGAMAVASVYVFAYFFGLSSGPIAWNVCSEIFPSHINAKCCAITTCTQWACQIIIAAITPLLLASIGTLTFTVYGALTVLGLIFCWACVPETRGVALGKEMSIAFGQDSKDDDAGETEEIEDIVDEVTPLLVDPKRRRRSSVAIVV
jgi:sugar porter (SP) family MFS transporter